MAKSKLSLLFAFLAGMVPSFSPAGDLGPVHQGMSELGPYIRTPDSRFENLPGYNFEPHYWNWKGLRVHYVDEGPRDGAAVLLLHGEPSWSYLYRKMIPVIADAGHRVISPDLVGFGRSDKLTRRRDYSYMMQVEMIQAFIREHDLKDIALFCQDWGGLIGLRAVADDPAPFARVIAANTALPGRAPRPAGESIPRLKVGGFMMWLTYSQLVPVFSAGQIVQMATVNKLPPEVVAAYDAPFPDRRFKAGARVYPTLVPTQMRGNTEAWKKLANFGKPFLTAFSDKDPILGGGDIVFQKVVAGAKGQPHVTTREAGHFLQEDKGEELGKLVVDFIEATTNH